MCVLPAPLGLSSFNFEAGKDVNRLFGLSCVFSMLKYNKRTFPAGRQWTGCGLVVFLFSPSLLLLSLFCTYEASIGLSCFRWRVCVNRMCFTGAFGVVFFYF